MLLFDVGLSHELLHKSWVGLGLGSVKSWVGLGRVTENGPTSMSVVSVK